MPALKPQTRTKSHKTSLPHSSLHRLPKGKRRIRSWHAHLEFRTALETKKKPPPCRTRRPELHRPCSLRHLRSQSELPSSLPITLALGSTGRPPVGVLSSCVSSDVSLYDSFDFRTVAHSVASLFSVRWSLFIYCCGRHHHAQSVTLHRRPPVGGGSCGCRFVLFFRLSDGDEGRCVLFESLLIALPSGGRRSWLWRWLWLH